MTVSSNECVECGQSDDLIIIIEKGQDTGEFICQSCVDTSDAFGLCIYCGYEAAYPIGELNEAGECSSHYGESVMDPEEEEGWEDNIQRWNEE